MRYTGFQSLLQFQLVRVTVFGNDRQPGVIIEREGLIMLFIFSTVITDHSVGRDHVMFVDDAVADTAVFTDRDIVQQDAVMNGCIAVNVNRVKENGVGNGTSGDDTAVANDGVDCFSDSGQTVGIDFFVMDEFCSRQTEMVVVDGP